MKWTLFRDEYLRPAWLQKKCFRLYSKGFLGKQSVVDRWITMAGVEVVICDPKGCLVLQVSKNLESLVDGEVVTDEVVELMALMEGLNQALTLGLKRLTFLCEDNEIYQYVCGKKPQYTRIVTLVNEIAFLQRQFTYCKPSFVTRDDMKYATYKFAKDARLSQIIQSLKETCGICFENIDFDKMFSIDGCLHRFCFSCMKKHAEVKLLAGMEAKCPQEGCKSKVSVDSCKEFLEPKLVDILSQKIKESSISVTEKVYCPYPKCSVLMSKSEVLQYTNTIFFCAEENEIRKCVKCYCLFCIKCKIPWHSNMTCKEFKRSKHYLRSEEAKLESLRQTKRWSKCKNCQHMIERTEGCNHIICRCGYEFCYTCGAEWKNMRATCFCPSVITRRLLRVEEQEYW